MECVFQQEPFVFTRYQYLSVMPRTHWDSLSSKRQIRCVGWKLSNETRLLGKQTHSLWVIKP